MNNGSPDPPGTDTSWRRRDIVGLALATGLSLTADAAAAAENSPAAAASPAQQSPPAGPTIGMLVYDNMILMDLNGPQTVLSIIMAKILLVAKTTAPVRTDVGVLLQPTATFETCPRDLDVLFVPGGLNGTIACMGDREVLDFVADRGQRARYVTSVCTGSLLLGAAGLLKGYRATSHWYVRDLLPLMGATLDASRVVEDRNRITGAGVTAGIDFGLTLAARLAGVDRAKMVQLLIEYDPHPPFDAGSPEGAGPALTNAVLARRAPVIQEARRLAILAGGKIAGGG